MFSAIARVFRTPDLRRKIWFTLGIIFIYRLGAFVPAPGVDYGAVQVCLAQGNTSGGLYSFVNMFSGGAMLQVSVFALGIMPYITAAIIVQLLRVVIPRFEELQKEGAQGQSKLTQYTRYLTIALGLLNATTIASLARTGALLGCNIPIVPEDNLWTVLLLIVTLTTGTIVIMWLGELITERGVGNGMSLLIFLSIAAGFPAGLGQIWTTQGWRVFGIVLIVGLLTIMAVVFVEESQRRVPVQYAKRQVGRKSYGGTTTYLPIKVNQAGIIPVIFASSLLYIPSLIVQLTGSEEPWAQWVATNMDPGRAGYLTLNFLLILFFAYFYVSITFNPEETADNMKQYGGFIPGIRAGKPTSDYLAYVLNRITLPGALYLATIATLPYLAFEALGVGSRFAFGGTSILIIVSVALDTVKQIESQLQQRNYEGFLK